MPSPHRRFSERWRRTLLVVALAVTFGSLVAPMVVSTERTYTLSYVGTDYEADTVRDAAYFWTRLGDDERTRLTAARRVGSVTLSESPGYLDGDGDTRFSVVDDERVYQYRVGSETDPWWLRYRVEAMLSGFVLTVGTAGLGVLRRVETVWE